MLRLLASAAAASTLAGAQAIPVGAPPVGLALGGGSAWVLAGGSVIQLDTATGAIQSRVKVSKGNSEIGDVAFDRNVVWATGDRNFVYRIDPTQKRVVAKVRVGAYPWAITPGAGSVWVTVVAQNGPGWVVRIDPATNLVVARIKVGDGPDAVVPGLGSVWVANTSRSSVMRIDPRTNRVVGTFLTHRYSDDIAVGRGVIWVAGERQLVALDPRGRIVRRLRMPKIVGKVAFDAGRLWATDDCGCNRGTLFRIDGGRVTSYRVGTTPVDLEASSDVAWVANFNSRNVMRVPAR